MKAAASNTLKIEINWPVRDLNSLPKLEINSTHHFLEIRLGPDVVFNSSGIRDWIRWLKPAAGMKALSIQLFECPDSFVQLLNMISDFIPANAEVMSFYVPFYSEHTSETKKVLLTRGHEYVEEKVILPSLIDKEGNPMILDVDPKRFFKFLEPKKS